MSWKSLITILAWYSSNIGVLLLNKFLLSTYGFKYPVFLTMCHMVGGSLMGWAFFALSRYPRQTITSRRQLSKILVLAAVFCLSVVLGNASLRFIPVSFAQAIGATTPFFTALLSFALAIAYETPIVYATLVPVVLGIAVASNGEPLFNLIGFSCAVAATTARAFKSVLQGVMLTDDAERMDSMSLLFYMAPMAASMLLPATLLLERDVLPAARSTAATHPYFLGALFLNCALAYFVNLTNFLVTKHTSALTLQVLGNAKGVVASVVSVMIFRNPVTAQGALGYAITIAGVYGYSQAKKRAALDGMAKELRSPLPSFSPEFMQQATKLTPRKPAPQL